MSDDKNPIEDAVEQALDAFVYAPIGLLFDGPARFPKLVRNGRNQVTNARMMGQFAVQMGRSEVEKRAKDVDGPLAEVLRGLGITPPATPAPAPAPTPTEANPTSGSDDGPDTATATTSTSSEKSTAKKSTAKKTTAKKTTVKKTRAKRTAAKKATTRKSAKKSKAGNATGKSTARKSSTTKATEASTAKTADPATADVPDVAILAITDYDSLSASQVVSRLRGLDAGALDAVARYETANRGRKTVLTRVIQLQKP